MPKYWFYDSNFWAKFISTGFGVSSFIPYVPAAWGVILGGVLSLLINSWSLLFKFLVLIVITLIGIPAATKTEKILNKGKDPQAIVIDEIGGIIFSALFFNLYEPVYVFNRFIPLFLLIIAIYICFDSLEPFPIKRIEKLEGGWGIILDDLMAGVYTILSLTIILRML